MAATSKQQPNGAEAEQSTTRRLKPAATLYAQGRPGLSTTTGYAGDFIFEAAERVPNVTVQLALGYTLYYAMNVASGVPGYGAAPLAVESAHAATALPIPDIMSGLVVLSAVVLYGVARLKKLAAQTLVDLGWVFEVIVCFAIALSENWAGWPDGVFPRGVSLICLVLLVFPLMIPNTPGKMWLAAFASVVCAPVAMMISSLALDVPFPPSGTFWMVLSPITICAFMAVFPGDIVHRAPRDNEGEHLGSYQLIEPIGRGGMGEVWKARHRLIARPAAVKLIRTERLGVGAASFDQPAHQRFEREARAIAGLSSPHTIELYDFGLSQDGALYYVMELLEGVNLEQLVERFGPIEPARAVAILRQMCLSLREAHDVGLVHRDIKPANVHISYYGGVHDFVKVLDFGLVRQDNALGLSGTRITQDGLIGGTPSYIAPEIASGSATFDRRVDIYCLGCVAYWMLTGTVVFEETSVMRMLMAHAEKKPETIAARLGKPVHPELERLIMRCLSKDPQRRPANGGEMLEALEALDIAPWTRHDAAAWWHAHLPDHGESLRGTDLETTNMEVALAATLMDSETPASGHAAGRSLVPRNAGLNTPADGSPRHDDAARLTNGHATRVSETGSKQPYGGIHETGDPGPTPTSEMDRDAHTS